MRQSTAARHWLSTGLATSFFGIDTSLPPTRRHCAMIVDTLVANRMLATHSIDDAKAYFLTDIGTGRKTQILRIRTLPKSSTQPSSTLRQVLEGTETTLHLLQSRIHSTSLVAPVVDACRLGLSHHPTLF